MAKMPINVFACPAKTDGYRKAHALGRALLCVVSLSIDFSVLVAVSLWLGIPGQGRKQQANENS
eukprot:15455299-Alexandrium_andersonii.AAC.1